MRECLVAIVFLFIWVTFSSAHTSFAGIDNHAAGYTNLSREAAESRLRTNEANQNRLYIQGRSSHPGLEDERDIISFFRETDVQNFDIPIVFNDEVEYYIKYFTDEKRKVFQNWLRRSSQYVPLITKILRQHNMPEDLVYLAMIESGFNPKAYSHAKASGPWQFIQETGARYGLKVNHWVDERRDPEKSTIAAAKYLQDLFNQFDCWYLAAAGYNAGENRVVRAIQKYDTNDFWEIHKYKALPQETRNYVPQLIAAAIIAKEPEKYSFDSITSDSPVRLVSVRVPPSTPLSILAKASSLNLDRLRSYNPELLRGITPPGKNYYEMKLPDSIDKWQFKIALENALANHQKEKNIIMHKVRQNDSIARIAERYGARSEEIHLANNWNKTPNLKTGMTIKVPGSSNFSRMAAKTLTDVRTAEHYTQKNKTGSIKLSKSPQKAIKTVSTSKKVPTYSYHAVIKGDTLKSISNRYDISIKDIKRMNGLKGNRLRPDTNLKLAYYKAKKEMPKVIYHTVKRGESFSSLSKKYGVSIDEIKSINRLKLNDISVGTKLKIAVNGLEEKARQ